MAVPKRKTSVSKKKMRRSHHKINSVNVVEDKKSGEYKLCLLYTSDAADES